MASTPTHLEPIWQSRIKRWIPWSLVLIRLILAPSAILIVWLEMPRWIWLTQFFVAIVSDIYDGKLARRWGVASVRLRRADSITDDVYAFACLVCFWLAEPEIISAHIVGIVVVAVIDVVRAPLDWYKFGKRASYHSLSARAFGISLIPVGIMLMGFGEVYWFLWLSLTIGLVAEVEGITMSLVLPTWTHDVKHVGFALVIRREYYREKDSMLFRFLAKYRSLPEHVRLIGTATFGALIGLVTYEIIYFFMPIEPRATISWIIAFLIGVTRQHGLHRWLTFADHTNRYWPSLGRAYVMYSGSLVVGGVLDWTLTELLNVNHRVAWVGCLITTMLISLIFLRGYVFAQDPESVQHAEIEKSVR